jgi:hypothetical protein
MPDGKLVMYHIGGGALKKPLTYCAANATSACGQQSFDKCGPPPPSPCGLVNLKGWACHAAAVGPGAEISEPTVDCDGTWAGCAPMHAAVCAATKGCVAFSISAVWDTPHGRLGLNRSKLFAVSRMAPNTGWTTWVKANAADDAVMAPAQRKQEQRPSTPCMLDIHVADSAAGPWRAYGNASIYPCAGNNPAPWVHPNGTVFIVFTDAGMGMWRAASWQGPYEFVVSGACGGGEDPSLWVDPRGHWHCLFHRAPFSDPDVAIGHAFSVDGYDWTEAAQPAANSTIRTVQHGDVVHGKRERPHLYFDAAGSPTSFVSGVCINPQCDAFSGSFDANNADCSSLAQYHNCDTNDGDGWYDRTYTLVQGVRGRAPTKSDDVPLPRLTLQKWSEYTRVVKPFFTFLLFSM